MMTYSILHLNEVHPLPHPNRPLVKGREPDFSCFPPCKGGIKGNTARLRRFVGWVEGRETQQSPENVGFRSSTQPTSECFFGLNRAVFEQIQQISSW